MAEECQGQVDEACKRVLHFENTQRQLRADMRFLYTPLADIILLNNYTQWIDGPSLLTFVVATHGRGHEIRSGMPLTCSWSGRPGRLGLDFRMP